MRDFTAAGKTILVSSHVLAELAQTVDRVVIIDRGRLVTVAELDALTANLSGGVRIRASRVHAFVPQLAAAGLEATLLDGDEAVVHGATAARVGELAAAAGVVLHELVQESSTLEKVFLELTARSEP